MTATIPPEVAQAAARRADELLDDLAAELRRRAAQLRQVRDHDLLEREAEPDERPTP